MTTLSILTRMLAAGWQAFKTGAILTIAFLLLTTATRTAAARQPAIELDTITDQISEIRATFPTQTERFRQPDDRWDIDSDDEFELYYHVGAYYIYVGAADLVVWGASDIEADDFYLEVDAFHVNGPLDNQFGVIFRQVDADNFYFFAISSDGYYRLQKRVDGQWETLIPWTESDHIAIDEYSVNQIGVLAQGNQIGLLVNDTVVGVVTDDSFATGFIALAASTLDEPGVEIAFDDLHLWELEEVATVEATPRTRLGLQATATPTPVSGVNALLADYRAEAALLSDDFNTAGDDWAISAEDAGKQQIVDGEFVIEITQADTMLWSTYYRGGNVAGRYLVEVDVELVDGPPSTDMGLLVQVTDSENYLYYAIRGNGTYGLWRQRTGDWETLIDWTPEQAIKTGAGATNRLAVYRTGSILTLFVNDVVVAQAPNTPTAHGWFALAAAANSGEPVLVAFDNFALWTDQPLPELEPAITTTPALPDLTDLLAEILELAPDVSDEFRRDTGDWGTAAGEKATLSYHNRAFLIEIDSPDWLSWSLNQQIAEDQLDTFYLEVDIEQVAGPQDAEYGVVFRFVDGDNFYAYYLSGHGTFSLWRKVDGEWLALIPWSTSQAMTTGEGAVNRLGLLVEGDQMTLFINDVVVGQATDDSLTGGQLGLIAGSFEAGGVAALFDNFDFWDLSVLALDLVF